MKQTPAKAAAVEPKTPYEVMAFAADRKARSIEVLTEFINNTLINNVNELSHDGFILIGDREERNDPDWQMFNREVAQSFASKGWIVDVLSSDEAVYRFRLPGYMLDAAVERMVETSFIPDAFEPLPNPAQMP